MPPELVFLYTFIIISCKLRGIGRVLHLGVVLMVNIEKLKQKNDIDGLIKLCNKDNMEDVFGIDKLVKEGKTDDLMKFLVATDDKRKTEEIGELRRLIVKGLGMMDTDVIDQVIRSFDKISNDIITNERKKKGSFPYHYEDFIINRLQIIEEIIKNHPDKEEFIVGRLITLLIENQVPGPSAPLFCLAARGLGSIYDAYKLNLTTVWHRANLPMLGDLRREAQAVVMSLASRPANILLEFLVRTWNSPFGVLPTTPSASIEFIQQMQISALNALSAIRDESTFEPLMELFVKKGENILDSVLLSIKSSVENGYIKPLDDINKAFEKRLGEDPLVNCLLKFKRPDARNRISAYVNTHLKEAQIRTRVL